MHTVIRKMGNSRGVIIPKLLLLQAGLENDVEMSIENEAIVLRAPCKKTREGWAKASKAIAETGDDALIWPEFTNENDEELIW